MKYGRRSPKNHPAIMLGDVLTGVVPAHPVAADYIGIGGWNMLGNDEYGDCVAVTWANVRRLVTRVLGGIERYPTLTEVIAFYKTQNPGFPDQDEGMDIQTALETLVKSGGPDETKAVCFAKVDHTNPDEVKAAVAIFGYVWTGINVQNRNMDDFNNHLPWQYRSSDSLDGGHSVIVGGYGPPATKDLGGDERFITWARETSFTDGFWTNLVEEAWVVVWPEHLTSKAFESGVDQAALASAYTALTGRPFPVGPTPVPTPQPPDPAVDADQVLAVAQRTWEQHEDNMKTMRSCDKVLEAANQAWRDAKGIA